jgi:hypothetical protein
MMIFVGGLTLSLSIPYIKLSCTFIIAARAHFLRSI